MNRVAQNALLVAAIGACLGFAGCGKQGFQRASVAGQVLIDDKPLTLGYIRFIPSGGGRPSITNIGSDGHFDFGSEGVVVGRNRVEVIANEPLGATGYKWHAPEKYTSYAQSGLEQEVTGPLSDVTIKLTWAGGKPYTVKSSGPVEADPKNLKGRK